VLERDKEGSWNIFDNMPINKLFVSLAKKNEDKKSFEKKSEKREKGEVFWYAKKRKKRREVFMNKMLGIRDGRGAGTKHTHF